MSAAGRTTHLACAGILTAAVAIASGQMTGTDGRAVLMRSPDGRMVTGVYVAGERTPSAAVVLVPMPGRPRADWDGLLQSFVQANIAALAVDLPDETTGPEPTALEPWQSVVDAALDYLLVRPDVPPAAIGIVGASLGATLAAMAAADDARVRSLALLSPSLEYRGLPIGRALTAYGDRPVLLVASRGDPYAARSVRELAAAAPGRREVLWSDVPAHGTFLLMRQPELGRSLAEWFQRTLALK